MTSSSTALRRSTAVVQPLPVTVVMRHFDGVLSAAFTLRVIALTAVVTVLLVQEETAPVLLCLPGVAASLIGPARSPVRRSLLPWGGYAWVDGLSALAVFSAAAWATTELPVTWRYLAVGAGSLLVAVVTTRLCLDPHWYRETPIPSRPLRWFRLAAGPIGVVGCQLVALNAPWGPGERTVVFFLTVLPLASVPLIVDQDQAVRCVVAMIRAEAQDGRQAVLDELHGTLSANLRLLEQVCLELRPTAPRLYELAVGANSRLRETLALADPLVDSAGRPQTLSALVRTLTMAVGAGGELTVRVEQLSESDRDLVRLAINDLLRACLARGAPRVQVEIALHRGVLQVLVISEDPAGEPDDPDRLDPLRRRLEVIGGSVVDRRSRAGSGRAGESRSGAVGRRLAARWPASPGTG